MIALLIINDLNILSIKLGYSEIPFEFFQFLMDILKKSDKQDFYTVG